MEQPYKIYQFRDTPALGVSKYPKRCVSKLSLNEYHTYITSKTKYVIKMIPYLGVN